jgi:hypothetical protein
VTSAEPARLSPALSFLPRPLREPRRPWLAILTGYLLSITGSLALAGLISLVTTEAQGPNFGWLKGSGIIAILVLAILSPLLETLILVATTGIMLRFVRPAYAILLSSLGWAIAHSYQAPIWGLVIWWPFIIFTTLFVVWKQRSLAWGIAMPFIVHMLQNLLPAIMIGYGAGS